MAPALCGIPFRPLPTEPRVENYGIPHLSKVAAWHGKGQHVEYK